MKPRESALQLFFATSACSWVPHWACHYYRLETGSTFAVGSWAFSPADSVVSMIVYAMLGGASLVAIVGRRWRSWAAGSSGVAHLAIAAMHVYRLASPFRFEVLGYDWSLSASLRESAIVGSFGAVSVWVATKAGRYVA